MPFCTHAHPGGRSVTPPALALLVGLVAAGCGPAADLPGFAGSIVDSAGVVVVTSPDKGLWAPETAWTVEEELRIGSFGGDPRYQFAQVGSIALTTSGAIWVMDRQTRELRLFDAQGRFLRATGTPGEGPGEFGRGVADVLVAGGDSLLIPDVRNRRIQRLDPGGGFVDSAPLDLASYRVLRFRWNAAARRGAAQVRPASVLEEHGPESVEDEVRVVELDGTLGRVLARLPSGGLLGSSGLEYFTPEPVWTLTDSLTVVYGLNDRYRIGLYDQNGELRRVVTRDRPRRALSDRDLRALYGYLDRAWLDAGVPPSQLPQNRAGVRFAEFLPAFADVHQGPEGTLWVQPVQAPGERSDDDLERYNFIEEFGSADWDVYDREGRLLGVVAMPARVQPRLFVGDTIYAVARDELDVQYIVRLRIHRGG